MKKISLLFLILLYAFLLENSICLADSAEVMPKGITRIDVEGKFYRDIDERYDSNGNTVDLASQLNFELSDLGIPYGGHTEVSFELEHQEVEILFGYGLTDKFSIGILVPYYWTKNKVDAEVVGNPVVTTEDLQAMLVSYGYDPLEDWSNDGIADIEAGGRYQYFNSDKWRLAFTGALRFPTGDQDIDSLASFDHGEGAWAILMHSNNDYVGIDNLILNATFRFEYVFEYDEKVRVPAEGEMLTSNKENVDIDPGNVIEIELSGKYTFDNGFGIAALYEYGKRFEDDISGDNNHSYYTILELDSDAKSHIYMVSLSYSTLNLFLEKKFPVPLNVAIGYRNRFAGENTLKSEYISLGATVYF